MQQWDFYGPEQRDGVRMSWNVWPSTRLEATRIVAPIGCFQVDYRTKVWTCVFCTARNHFPPHYAENISETSLPAELIPHFTTVEYELPVHTAIPITGPPTFLFVLDICVDEEELAHLRDSLLQTLNLLPEDALIGLITFGTLINVYELGFNDCSKAYTFRGEKDYPLTKVQEMLHILPTRGLQGSGAPPPSASVYGRQSALGRFLLPVSEALFHLEQILEDLIRDPWPSPPDERPARCTGNALNLAISLLELAVPRQGSRVLLFTSGPPSVGSGSVVNKSRKVPIRSHTDMHKGQAPLVKPSIDFYKGLAERCVNAFIVVDLFACSLDQVGAMELKILLHRVGGVMVLADKYSQSMFRESLRKLFERPAAMPVDGNAPAASAPGNLSMGFGGTVELLCSRDVKVSGCIGPTASLKKAGNSVSDVEVGLGGTTLWYLGGMDPGMTVAFFFDVNCPPSTLSTAAPVPGASPKRRFIQFLTSYITSSQRQRLRVTTICTTLHTDTADLTPLVRAFDQEAAAVLLARLVVYRLEHAIYNYSTPSGAGGGYSADEVSDVMRYLDRQLIKLCAKFASYRKDDPSSFRLPPEFSLYPQFMFHLRRSKFLQAFNTSPDEQAFYRHVLLRESCSNSLIMLQPSLLSYSFSGVPQPVLLDATSVRPDTILLLDAFFHVIVFHGETIAAWKAQGYQNLEEHVNFRNLLNAPLQDAQAIIRSRFPIPRYILCDQHKSEARFLLSMLNPSVTHHTEGGLAGGQMIFTDDVSLRVFMEHLMKLAVQA
eukprot:scaffold2727_cov161-Ochromonas_danica.AAC.2